MSGKPRIVYMGTPEFAVAPLKAIVDAGHNVVAVITVPDKPAGRGQKIQQSPVKEYSLSVGLRVLQPDKLKDLRFIAEYESLNPDIAVVVAFRMLPEIIWARPTLGTFNLHASLLPQYRGAAPINWAVINGEKESGITTFLIDKEIDTGKILFREKVDIDENETAGELHDKLMTLGSGLVLKTIDALASGNVIPTPQDAMNQPSAIKPAPKLFKDTCKIDWAKSTAEVHNQIRGLSPYPAAWTEIEMSNGEKINTKILRSLAIPKKHSYQTGTIVTDNKSYLHIACSDGLIDVITIQMAGKRAMQADELMRGFQNSTLSKAQ